MSELLGQIVRNVDKLQREKEVDRVERAKIGYQHYVQALSATLGLPCIRACYINSIDGGSRLMDMGPNGLHLTRNSAPVAHRDTSDLLPYLRFYGSNDYWYHADDQDFDILGTETAIHSAARGLSIICWAYFDNATASANEYLVAKRDVTGVDSAYRLVRDANEKLMFTVTNGGDNNVISTGTMGTAWYHVAGTYKPSTSLSAWINGVETQNVASIPAAIRNSAANFTIGADGNGNQEHVGNLAYIAVCACHLTENYILAHYEMTRGCFGLY